MTGQLRIVVTGLAATYPFGGVFWDYLQYPLGLQRLGHQVLYVEDTGKWCYDPTANTFVEDGSRNAAYLAREIAALDQNLSDRWFFRDGSGKTYGWSWKQVADFCRSADLFIHISASCWMREEYFAAKRVAFIDSDPMYTQASVPEYTDGSIDDESRQRVEMLRRHDVFFTFGENVNGASCKIPKGVFDWIPTRQPIVLDCFMGSSVPVADRRRILTTVASWKSAEGSRVVDGITYEGKGVEFERFITFPSHSSLPIELAMSGQAPIDRLRAHGWKMTDAYAVSHNPWVYRDYLASSFGEWSVAKNAYVASRSGWFSCRTACYLALGVPAVVQNTAFDSAIACGEGLLAFNSPDEAGEAVDRIVSDPQKHSKAAVDIAREYFDSDKVLSRLVAEAMNGHGLRT